MTAWPADHQPEDASKGVPFVNPWHRPPPTRPGPPRKSVPPARPRPPKKSGPPAPVPPPAPPSQWRWLLPAAILIAFVALLFFRPGAGGGPPRAVTYHGVVGYVSAGKVSTAAITATGSVSGKLLDAKAYTSQIPTALNDNALSALLLGHKVQVTGTIPSTNSVLGLIVDWILPIAIVVVLFTWLARRNSKQLTGRFG